MCVCAHWLSLCVGAAALVRAIARRSRTALPGLSDIRAIP